MDYIRIVCALLLVFASTYASFMIQLEKPYAFVACSLAVCHGTLGVLQGITGETSQIKELFDSIMEIVPLSLINIEFYTDSSKSEIAKAHWFFLIPLTFDLIATLFTEEGGDASTQALKDMTIIGNIVSLIYLAVIEEKYIHVTLAGAVLMSKYGSILLNFVQECSQVYGAFVFEALFYIFLTQALSAGGDEEGVKKEESKNEPAEDETTAAPEA